jgi:ATP-binding cassette subfamily F protein uup
MSFNEKYEFERIDDEIIQLEEKLESVEKEISAAVSDFVKLTALTKEKEEVAQKLEEKMERWVYLHELNQAIEDENR